MQSLPSKRAYTTKALEHWFGCLEDPWESHFTQNELEQGREIYRQGEIRAVELTEQDAIIHRRLEKSEEYAVIEWKNGAPSIRFSRDDQPAGRVVAVAGLLEIEELIADELVGPAAGDRDAIEAATAGEKTQRPATASKASGSQKARPVVIRFHASSEGLVFEALWQNENGSCSPLQGFGKATSESHARNLEERKRMINLTALAKRARFRFVPDLHAYVLTDLRQIPDFLKRSLADWRRVFTVELDANVKALAEGPKTIHFRTSASLSSNGGASGGLDLRWIFEAGERLLNETDAAKLLAAPSSPILVPDIGLVSLADEKAESLKRMRSGLTELPEGSQLPNYLIFSLFQNDGNSLSLAPEIEAWKTSLISPPKPLTGLPEFLRPYQRRGVEWLAHLCDHECHGLLADEMGLGKTIQVLSLLAARPITDQPNIIVCPASVIPVWRDEIARHFPHIQVEQLKGNRTFVDVQKPVVWISSYAQLRRQRPLLDVVEFGYAILDEAQFIKNPEAKVTAACFSIRARHRIALTGTPLENRQLDLWSLFRFLMPGFLGSRAVFEQALLTDRERTLMRMRAQVLPFMLRRTKDEVASELPQKVQITLACPLTDLQRIEYARICSEGLQRLGPDLQTALRERSFGVFSLLTRLRQACCDPKLLPWVEDEGQNSGKIGILVERLGEIIAGGHKVVIFSQFVALLKRVRLAIESNFPELSMFEITGATLDRRKPVQNFQEGEGAAVMLVSLKAAGTGITLHAADYVFLMDPWWNPAVEEQAVDRVHRIGQTRTVFVYRLLAPGTIEERIQALQANKREMFRQVIDDSAPGEHLHEHFKTLDQLIQLGEVVATE
jgi:superfamily II DNA or RNA helicase